MEQHVLLELATRRRHRSTPEMPHGATYDVVEGCWMLNGKALEDSVKMIHAVEEAVQEWLARWKARKATRHDL